MISYMQSQGNLREPRTDFSLKGGRGFKRALNAWLGEGGQEEKRKELPAVDLNLALIGPGLLSSIFNVDFMNSWLYEEHMEMER